MRLVFAFVEAGVTLETLNFCFRAHYHLLMTIPLPLRRTKNDIPEELCVYCLTFTSTLEPTCTTCDEERIPYPDDGFLQARIKLLKEKGYLDPEEEKAIGFASETPSPAFDVGTKFADHLSHFADYLEDARFVETFSFSKKWFEKAALEMLRYFPLPKTRFEEFANYKSTRAIDPVARLKSIWLLYPNDQVKWMSRIATLKIGATSDTNFFGDTIRDHVKMSGPRAKDIGVFKFDDDLINEFIFTLFHPAILVHPAFEKLLASVDKERMTILLNGFKCQDENLAPWVRLALHFCGALPADPNATGDIALSQKIMAGVPLDDVGSLALIDRLSPQRQAALLEPLTTEEFLAALTKIKTKNLWALVPVIHSRVVKLEPSVPVRRELESVLESAISSAPTEKIPELFDVCLRLRDSTLFDRLVWRIETVSDSQWTSLIPVFREAPAICELFRRAPSVRTFKLGLDIEPFLAEPALRGWALDFVKRGDATHENTNRSIFNFYLDHARSLDRETLELATWSLPLKAIDPKLFDANSMTRLFELLGEALFDEDSRLGDWLQKNEEPLKTAAAGLGKADSIKVFDVIVNRFSSLNRHRRFFSKFLTYLEIGNEELAARASRIRDLKVGESVDLTYWFDRMLEKVPKELSRTDAEEAEAKKAAAEAKRVLEEAQNAATTAKAEVEAARQQLEEMKFQNELLNMQMWLQKEIAACQLNTTMPMEAKAARFTEIQKEYESKIAAIVEKRTKG